MPPREALMPNRKTRKLMGNHKKGRIARVPGQAKFRDWDASV
jgi:hypothetical protein